MRARFLDRRWDDLERCDPAALVAGLQAYIADPDSPILPRDDPRLWDLHGFLRRTKPVPSSLRPLYGPSAQGGKSGVADEVTDAMLRRDTIALAVVTSFIRQVYELQPGQAELFDAIVEAGVHFSFDPAYGDSHTGTGVEISDFMTDPRVPVCTESEAAMRKHLPALLERWRKRATRKASSTFFGTVLRHLGEEGGEALAGEWDGMDEDERYDLVKRLGDEEAVGPAARTRLVEALLDPSLEVRKACGGALEALGAPVGDLDPTARDADLRKAQGPLRRWAAGSG